MFSKFTNLSKNLILKQSQNLQFTQKYSFSRMPTHQANIITKQNQDLLKTQYSRDYYQLLQENPNYKKETRERERQQKKQQIENELKQLKQNDQNPANYIKVTINPDIQASAAKVRTRKQFNLQDTVVAQDTQQLSAHPFVVIHKPREPKVTVTGIRRNLPTTLKKLRLPMKMILKKQVFDAMTMLDAIPTKSANLLNQVVKQVIRHAKQRDMDINRLYINGVVIGKQRRFKHLYYKAKMQMGIVNKDICQVKLTLEERPYKEMYKEVLQGKTPPTLALILREQLKRKTADYQTLRKWSHILTSKGRQQQRLMFKRKVIQKQQEYSRYGVQISKQIIAQKLLEVESQHFADQYEQRRLELDQESINRRTAIYKKNEEITGFN